MLNNGVLVNTDIGWFVKMDTLFFTDIKYRLHPSDIKFIVEHKLEDKYNNKFVKFYLTKKVFGNWLMDFGISSNLAKLDDEFLKV